MKKIFTSLLLAFSLSSLAQQKELLPVRSITVGFEVDVLPYITGGYYGSGWIGYDHWRYRAIITKITTPDFVLKDGFANNRIQAYTLIADFFFQPDFKGWWIGAGFEYWKGEIQSDAKLNIAKYDSGIFTAGGGYVWKFHKHFYLNPWAASHIRIAGDNNVIVDGKTFTPPVFTPELSLKVGWHF